MIENLNKISIINSRLETISVIIERLSYGIENIPWNDEKGIDQRQSELSDYILKKQSLLQALDQLQ